MQQYQQLAYLSVSHADYLAGGSVPDIAQLAQAPGR